MRKTCTLVLFVGTCCISNMAQADNAGLDNRENLARKEMNDWVSTKDSEKLERACYELEKIAKERRSDKGNKTKYVYTLINVATCRGYRRDWRQAKAAIDEADRLAIDGKITLSNVNLKDKKRTIYKHVTRVLIDLSDPPDLSGLKVTLGDKALLDLNKLNEPHVVDNGTKLKVEADCRVPLTMEAEGKTGKPRVLKVSKLQITDYCSKSPLRTAGFIVGAVGAASLAAAAVLYYVARDISSKEDLSSNQVDEYNTLRGFSIGTFYGGGILLVLGIAGLWYGDLFKGEDRFSSDSATHKISATPVPVGAAVTF